MNGSLKTEYRFTFVSKGYCTEGIYCLLLWIATDNNNNSKKTAIFFRFGNHVEKMP